MYRNIMEHRDEDKEKYKELNQRLSEFKSDDNEEKSVSKTEAKKDPTLAADKPAGFGSIWNNNSWFFEEKNFTKFAKDWLTREL